ncbi:MAG TPA: hypothetical protein DCL38_05710 [Lachnospiraceae bacterium]|nr:hypothetical protein [Lachnospiraceae bacterium]
MEYRYSYRIRTSDLWQARMYYAYASYLATVNIVCIFASIVLMIVFWKNAEPWVRLVMLLFFSLFTVLQPAYIYFDCRKQLKGRDEELELTFNEKGLVIRIGDKLEKHPFRDIAGFNVRPTLVIVYTGNNQGYILTNRVLKDTRRDFIEFMRRNLKRSVR